MPVRVGRIKGSASRPPRIVIHCVGSDGMEVNREILSLSEAERLIEAVRRSIASLPPSSLDAEVRKLDDRTLSRWENEGGSVVPTPPRPRPPGHSRRTRNATVDIV